jgi:uncharacterized phage infection (PIP) family protein YhgE
LGLLLTAFAPLSVACTKETPLEYGKAYTISGTVTQRWYLGVNIGDNISVNISSAPSGASAQVNLDATLYYSESSNDTILNNNVLVPLGPYVFWFKCACPQRIWLEFMTAAPSSMTYNITRINGTVDNTLAEITKLNQSLAQLNATVAGLNASLANLTSAFLSNLSLINGTLNAIQNYLAYLNSTLSALNISVYDMNSSLRAEIAGQIAALNATLNQADALLKALSEANDTVLRGLLDTGDGALNTSLSALGVKLGVLRADFDNLSFPTPDQYNDTPIWRELTRLNSTPPITIVEMNNTTLVNTTLVNTTEVYPTNYTVVNQTTNVTNNVTKTIEKPAQNEGGIVAGVGAGIASGAVAGVVAGRRRKEFTP